MKLSHKINLVALGVMIFVSLALATSGVTIISKVTFKLNRELMSREVENIVSLLNNAIDILKENRLDGVEIYRQQAQSDVLAELKDYQYRTSGELIIITSTGKRVKGDAAGSAKGVDSDALTNMLRSSAGVMALYAEGRQRYYNYQYFPNWDWMVVLSVSIEEMLQPKIQFIRQVIIILFICLVLGSAIFSWFLRKIVEPIGQLAKATTYVSEGKWNVELPTPGGGDELSQLSSAFKIMAHRLEEMYDNLESNLSQIKKSQRNLQESEEKYRGLIELLPLSVFEIDLEGKFVFANRHGAETFGYTEADDFDSLTIFCLVTDDDRLKLQENIDVLPGEQNQGMQEYTGTRKDGSTFPSLLLTTPTFKDEAYVGNRVIFIDITDRKLLEDKLRDAQKFLEAILDNIADPVYVKDDQHKYILLNDSFCKLVEAPKEEILGKSETDFFPEQEANSFIQHEREVVSSTLPLEREMVINDGRGQQRIILTKKAAFRDEQGQMVLVGIIRDVTQRKKMEQELFKSDKLKSVGVLAGGIAHDFNNILTAVLGNLSLAKMYADREDKIYQHILASEKASHRAKDLTQQFLTFSRGGAPVRQTISIAHLLGELAAFTLRGSKVSYELIKPEKLWAVDVDEGQISRVVHNMLMNATQAMPEGGQVRITAENITISDEYQLPLTNGRYVKMSIQDFGCGMQQELLANIFDPYFTTKESGSGLGLATAFSIVKRHDGHIEVESEPGRGSIFSIYLPATDLQPSETEKHVMELHRGQGRILVMDDEQLVRDTMAKMLTELGYQYGFALDGNEALQSYSNAEKDGRPFDLVIMDLTIPGGMGGQETIRELLQIDGDAKAIVASGYSKDPVMSQYSDYGFKGVLAKPFELEQLSQTLHRIIGNVSAAHKTARNPHTDAP